MLWEPCVIGSNPILIERLSSSAGRATYKKCLVNIAEQRSGSLLGSCPRDVGSNPTSAWNTVQSLHVAYSGLKLICTKEVYMVDMSKKGVMFMIVSTYSNGEDIPPEQAGRAVAPKYYRFHIALFSKWIGNKILNLEI